MITVSATEFYDEYAKVVEDKLTKKEFKLLWGKIRDIAGDLFCAGEELNFCGNGYFVIKSADYRNRKNATPRIDIQGTKRLWENNKEAYLAREKVYYELAIVAGLYWIKSKVFWHLKRLYGFKTTMKIRSRITQGTKDGVRWQM